MKTNPKVECLIENHHGIYIPQVFAKRHHRETDGVSAEDWQSLLAGPEDDAYEWAWDNALNNAILTSESGDKYRIDLSEQGDVFIVPIDWEWSDSKGGWVEPESATLRRYCLPSYWICSLFNGDDSGLEEGESESINSFIKTEGLANWIVADSWGDGFRHSNDATNIGGDCSIVTFVLIQPKS